jgi:glyoxylase-like metal-dependent hydrolase (beta-lactamase superfamily II)
LHILVGPAGTVPGNLMVHDEATGVLFAGALLSVGRIPGVQDTRPADWQQALEALAAPDVDAVVPAYGPVAWPVPRPGQTGLGPARAALAGYFTDLEAQARALYAAATPLAELADRAALPRYRDWNGYPATHLHNIFYRYLQLEAEDLSSH